MNTEHIINLGLEGLGSAAIAELTGETYTAVVTTLSRARKQGMAIPVGKRGPKSTKVWSIVAMALDGMDPHAIAGDLGTDISSVTAALSQARQRGIPVPRFDGSLEHHRPRILELGAQGVTPAAIADELGISARYSTVTLYKARRDGAELPRYNGRSKAA